MGMVRTLGFFSSHIYMRTISTQYTDNIWKSDSDRGWKRGGIGWGGVEEMVLMREI